MNRIQAAVTAQAANIAQRLQSGQVTQEKLDALHSSLDMTLEEYCNLQNLKSAMMGIMLTTDEAQTLYNYLGYSAEDFNGKPLAIKVVITQIHKELLERSMR